MSNKKRPTRTQGWIRLSGEIGRQNDVMFGHQNPRYLASRTRKDLHSPFDGAGNRYRELFAKIAARQQAGDLSYGSDSNVGDSLAELFQMKPL